MKNIGISFSDGISSEPIDRFCPNLHRNMVGRRPTFVQILMTLTIFSRSPAHEKMMK